MKRGPVIHVLALLNIFSYCTMGILIILTIPIFVLGSETAAQAQTDLQRKIGIEKKEVDEEDDEDEEDEDDDDDDDDDDEGFTVSGFIELENYISTYSEQEIKDAFKKNEIRKNLKLKFGSSSLFFESDINLYAIPLLTDGVNSQYIYSHSAAVSRNMTVSGRGFELNFNKFYLNYAIGMFRFRLGNQVFAWGTADIFNPTSYFNSFDLREFLLKDEDEMKPGVPTFAALLTSGSHSLEIVLAPLHIPSSLPQEGNFWGIQYKEGPFPVKLGDPQALEPAVWNMGIGAQYSTSQWGSDINVSLYYGPDKEPAMRPMNTIIPLNEPVSIFVSPEYYTLAMFGLSLSKTISAFTVQLEGAYSPNKTGVVEGDYNGDIASLLPFAVRKCHFISYSGGFNYFIPINKLIESHEGDMVFTVEWTQSVFLDSEIMKPMITDFLITRLQDSFFNSKMEVSVTGIIDVSDWSFVIMPGAQYKFDRGISIALSYAYINSNSDSFLGYYNHNDVATVRIRYEY